MITWRSDDAIGDDRVGQHAGHFLQQGFQLETDAFDGGQVGALDLDAHRRAHAGL
jgi:hypothetical protein